MGLCVCGRHALVLQRIKLIFPVFFYTGNTEEAAGDAPVENNVAAPVTAEGEDIPAADAEEKGEEKAGEEA